MAKTKTKKFWSGEDDAPEVTTHFGTSLNPTTEVIDNPPFQEQIAELEDTVGVAGTTMTAQEAKELVEAGSADTLAEHPESVPPEPPPEEEPTTSRRKSRSE